ncbi:MAG: YjbQ family protein [Anaerolineales bacterium]|nr:YjbQ family protein [Anaerolineales bacterium]
MITLVIQTRYKSELMDITSQVQKVVWDKGLTDGLCVLFCPHTTAGLTLNENWDPDVEHDLFLSLEKIAPPDPRHRHGEGNSPAHLKTSLFGAGEIVLVEEGRLQLGSWQGIYLAEFDGPRTRKVWIKLVGDGRKLD